MLRILQCRRRVSVIAAVLIASPTALPRPSAQDRSLPYLVLAETRSIGLPTEYKLRGATLSEWGDIVYWGENSVMRLSAGTGDTTEVCKAFVSRPSGAAFVAEGGGIEVVDGATGTIYRSELSGICQPQYTIEQADSIVGAVRLGASWVIASVDTAGGTYIADYDRSGRSAWVVRGASQGAQRGAVHLRASFERVVVSSAQWPFRWLAVEANGKQTLASNPLTSGAGLGLPHDSTRWAGWVSLPVLTLDRGYLQTLADLASDARKLVLYDDNGEVQSVRDIDVPLGMIASDPKNHLLIGLRRTDRVGLVVYRWRWESAGTPQDARR